MIKKAQNMTIEMKQNMRGGYGEVEIMHLLDKEEINGSSRLIGKIKIDKGNSIGLHQHVNEEEIFYIIKGKGLVNDNGNTYEVEVGDSILTKGGESHSIESIGEVPLEMIAIILTY